MPVFEDFVQAIGQLRNLGIQPTGIKIHPLTYAKMMDELADRIKSYAGGTLENSILGIPFEVG